MIPVKAESKQMLVAALTDPVREQHLHSDEFLVLLSKLWPILADGCLEVQQASKRIINVAHKTCVKNPQNKTI